MMKMITKELLKKLRVDMDKALNEVGEKHNLSIELGNISFSNIDATGKIEIKTKEIDGISYEQAEFERLCEGYGFEKDDYKKTFSVRNKEFTLLGFNTRASKSPLRVADENGKEYRTTLVNRDRLR
jgi:hypothetical protein